MGSVQLSEGNTIYLFPKGLGFASSHEKTVVSKQDLIKAEAERQKFKRTVTKALKGTESGQKEHRKTRDERHFINKVHFASLHNANFWTDEILIDVLCDQNFLFSNQYQLYRTDHPAFFKLNKQRRQSGILDVERCLNDALTGFTGQIKAECNFLLRMIIMEVKRSHCSFSSFEKKMIDRAISRKISNDEILEFLKCAVNELTAEECVANTRDVGFELTANEIELLKTNLFYSRENPTTIDIDRARMFYSRYLTYNTQGGLQSVYKYLKTLMPWLDKSIERYGFFPNSLEPFMTQVLPRFFYCINILELDKAAAGHYIASAQISEYTAYQTYLKRKDLFSEAYAAYQQWENADISDVLEIIEKKTFDSMKGSDKLVQKELSDKTDELFAATKIYMNDMRLRFDEETTPTYLYEIMNQVYALCKEHNSIDWFPLVYLIVCVAACGTLLLKGSFVSGREIVHWWEEKRYYSKTSIKNQRVYRIRFLNNLLVAYKASKESQNICWSYYLSKYDFTQTTKAELDVWKRIIDTTSVPSVTFGLLLKKYSEDCFALNPQNLFSYNGGSKLHNGGFAAFLMKYSKGVAEVNAERANDPDSKRTSKVIDPILLCSQRILSNNKKWKPILSDYQKAWGSLELDVDTIRKLCTEKGVLLLRWETLPTLSDAELREFCRSLYGSNAASVSDEVIENNIKELKSLLVECAIRTVLNKQASEKVKEQIKRLLCGNNSESVLSVLLDMK